MIKKSLWAAILLMAPLTLQAQASAAATLGKALDAIQSFNADFEQQISESNGRLSHRSTGTLVVLRPGKFLWTVKTPDPIQVIADGETLWNYDIELEQVTKRPLEAVLTGSPAGLLIGEGTDLAAAFKIEFAPSAQCHQSADQCFSLMPLNATDDTTAFQQVYLSLEAGKLLALNMQDPLGQQIVTEFKNSTMNQPVEPSIFNFTPPEGVDVIETVR